MALPLTLACWDYDRVRALQDGRVRAEGIELNVLPLVVEETFFRMARHREFDASEMSLSSYVVSLQRPEPPFVALPVFPSRVFRHSAIYVRADSGIRRPQDLAGRRVGNAEYQMTAFVWIRGILSDHYGVPFDAVTYVTGGQERPDREEKMAIDLPPRVRVERLGPGETLSAMLRDGRIDALYAARRPSCYDGRHVVRLFPDYAEVEKAWFRETGIFPIMHTVVLRRDVYEAHRWAAMSLFKAFRAAQAACYEDLDETSALKAMLPWLSAHLEDTRALMGEDFWPYGLERNRRTLETFLRYHHEQGLSARQLRPDELFATETLREFVI